MKLIKIQRPDSHGQQSCTMPLKSFSCEDEFDGAEVGEEILLTLVEMSQEEYDQLPEFSGW